MPYFNPSRLCAGLLAAVSLACASMPARHEQPDLSDALLHIEYRSGGDAPVGFLLTVLDNGRVRYYSPRWRTYWAKLSDGELAELRTLIRSPDFLAGVETINTLRQFACCDSEEIGLSLGPEPHLIPIALDRPEIIPEPILDLLTFLNLTAKSHFGRRWTMPFPIAEGRVAAPRADGSSAFSLCLAK